MRQGNIVHVDGSHGEGGGQIVRTSLSLAAVLGRPVAIHRLREKRKRPGLQPQHLAAVLAAAEICDAELTGASVGSSELTFVPRALVRSGDYRFDIGTAGAAALVLQTVLLPLTLAGERSDILVLGGTHLPFSPPADYLAAVYATTLAAAGWRLDVQYDRAGYYPRGGGEIHAVAEASTPRGFDLVVRGRIDRTEVEILTSRLPDHVAQRGSAAAADALAGVADVQIRTAERPAFSPGAAVFVRVVHDGGAAGFSSIGEKGKPIEKVAEEACVQARAWLASDACCDEHLADQLVLPACLTPGASRWTTDGVSEHVRTVLWVASLFVPLDHSVERGPGDAWTISVRA